MKIQPMYYVVSVISTAQCPRMDLNKKSLPKPKTITAGKPIPHWSILADFRPMGCKLSSCGSLWSE